MSHRSTSGSGKPSLTTLSPRLLQVFLLGRPRSFTSCTQRSPRCIGGRGRQLPSEVCSPSSGVYTAVASPGPLFRRSSCIQVCSMTSSYQSNTSRGGMCPLHTQASRRRCTISTKFYPCYQLYLDDGKPLGNGVATGENEPGPHVSVWRKATCFCFV